MARDLTDAVRDALSGALSDAVKNIGDVGPQKNSSPLSGAKGLAAGAGLAALVPLARKGVQAVRLNGLTGLKPGAAVESVATKAGEGVGSKLKEVASEKVDEAGGVGGMVKQAAGGLLPGGDGGGGGNGMPAGVGKGRRMPVQQAIDVAVPLETAYNQFTQFEEWPNFMHRVTRVSQDDECTVKFATKIWGITKEFQADIETQRPDERVKWAVSQGITHTGVATFHELAPRLTRIEVNVDVDPGSLIEKAARGMRHVKRAIRADLHRYKAFIEMQEMETGAWRGVIEEGELVEEHPEDYDEEREYSEIEDAQDSGDEDRDEAEDEDEDEDSQRQRTQRFKRQAERSRSSSASGDGRSESRSSSSRSRGRGSSNGSGSGSRSSGKRRTSSRS